MEMLKQTVSFTQIFALIKKDFLTRRRQPCIAIVQFMWPCLIFLTLYTLRNRFTSTEISTCQFPTRLLPSKHNLLPFFHSYICTFDNSCINSSNYQEFESFNEAPLKPVINIIQTFLNNDDLFNALIDLPTKMNFQGVILSIVTHPNFEYIKENIDIIASKQSEIENIMQNFDIKKTFSDNEMFSNLGNLICGKPFPRSNNIRLVDSIITAEDYNGPNKDELDAMPTKYCKKLYLDITSNNYGKLTWNSIKPILHGKILYAPETDETLKIIRNANITFREMGKLQQLADTMDKVMTKFHSDKIFLQTFLDLLDIIKSPFVQLAVGNSINITSIENVMISISKDENVKDYIETVHNILDCFSVDRFVPVQLEKDLKIKALELDSKKLFYAGIYFNKTQDKDVIYNLYMDIDNTPITIENQNPLWFPGPDGDFQQDLRYHRGFVQVKHSIDIGIIKFKSQNRDSNQNVNEDIFSKLVSDDDFYNSSLDNSSMEINSTGSFEDISEANETENDQYTNAKVNRKKRSPQFGDILNILLGKSKKKTEFPLDKLSIYTKQFPYPQYVHDGFKKGLYLSQSVQIAFFLGLIVQVASCIRQKIWMRESKNLMIMHSMGLKSNSHNISWSFMTFVEIMIIFFFTCVILYVGGILKYTDKGFIALFLFLYGLCLISFCYMCCTFFTSASIGSVASAIIFLITFLPYIVIVIMGGTLSGFLKFITNLSFSTAFCYGWSFIMQSELQTKNLSIVSIFTNKDNELIFAMLMIFLDSIFYGVIGYLVEYFRKDEYKFYAIHEEILDPKIGVVFENVSKVYDDVKVALSNISLIFMKNEVSCLLGRNGAGKSTIIKLLTGQIGATNGKLMRNINLNQSSGGNIGFCSQDNILIPQLTAKEHLIMFARIKMQDNFECNIEQIMKTLNFGKYENVQAFRLSGGYQRRLCIAIAFLGSPNLVILDEPCSGIDNKARKNVWKLIQSLRNGRAVIISTHYLDEAEYLGDTVLILNEGKLVKEYRSNTLKKLFTQSFDLKIIPDVECVENVSEYIQKHLNQNIQNYLITPDIFSTLKITIPYSELKKNIIWFSNFITLLENRMQKISITSTYFEDIFNDIQFKPTNGQIDHKTDICKEETTSFHRTIFKNLFWKRMLHFRRNYNLLLCIILLPAIFEIIAMSFMLIRPQGNYDKILNLNKKLYPKSQEFLSLENENNFTGKIYNELHGNCYNCFEFNSSKNVFDWILDTSDKYRMRRYGGITINTSSIAVWYNNKGYHAMLAWLNELNSRILKTEMSDSEYDIVTFNYPLQLVHTRFSTSSILQQIADAGICILILIAFSLVVAGASVLIVTERVSGEKLQLKLCGVKFRMYWSIAFLWDFMIYVIALILCVIIFQLFHIPLFVHKSNLIGICILVLLFGLATIPAVYVVEKLFSEPSLANMSIFCMNVIIALITLTIILLFDILGESSESEHWRNILNRLFLIFPQHALADGLMEICKNYLSSEILKRYDIDSYKSPITSNLLMPHYISLLLLGIIFMIINYTIESSRLNKILEKFTFHNKMNYELEVMPVQNTVKTSIKNDDSLRAYALKVCHLSKAYNRKDYAVNDVSFNVHAGECLGLLGNNGAGKSTIFKMLTGQLHETKGNIYYHIGKNISYCPQTIALDPLLTVNEIIKFYGELRRVINIAELIRSTLKSFHLEKYENVLVKNLSGGNRRKLAVAISCFGDTSIVLMDEPTTDMDPITRSLVYHAITKLVSQRRSVLLTSHTISEIEDICNRVALLKEGRLIDTGTLLDLERKFGEYYSITIFFDDINFEILEKNIIQKFPQLEDILRGCRSITFIIKVGCRNQNNSNIIEDDICISLSELLIELNEICADQNYDFTINKCKLHKIVEKAVDSANGNGYIHKAFVESETCENFC